MRRPVPLPNLSSACVLALTFALLVASGCGSSNSVAPIVTGPKLPVGTPGNTAPDSTVTRLLTAYQWLATADFDSLLAGNFRYHFSAQSDPTLVSYYQGNWDRAHEAQAFAHFGTGFTNSSDVHIPAAQSVSFQLINAVVSADTVHADSAAWYKVVTVSTLVLSVDVPVDGGGTTTYNISAPFVFHAVRGDAAVLDAGQSHAATRWYVAAIDDLSPIRGAAASGGGHDSPEGSAASTWGQLRAKYYN